MRFWGIQLNTNSFLSFKTKTKPVDDVTLDPGTKQVFSDKLNDKGLLYKMANCCKPIPGDQCVGYRFGDDIIVHKADCEKALQLMANQGNKIVAVNWTLQKRFSYVARVKIEGIDNFVLLRDIMTVISKDLNVRVKNVSINNLDGVLSGHIDLYTSNVKDIKSLIDNLSKVQGLVSVKRIDIDD